MMISDDDRTVCFQKRFPGIPLPQQQAQRGFCVKSDLTKEVHRLDHSLNKIIPIKIYCIFFDITESTEVTEPDTISGDGGTTD